tara:strand:+ start:4030 stop:4749 length:720 start_codon:yes stop_codon:yes gene_type:complete
MQRFINLSPKQSENLDKVIYKNALQLKKDAFTLAESRKSYSSATSLLILSSEEVIKATLVLLHNKNCEVYKIKDAKKFFTNHKIRHQIAQLIEMGSAFIEALDIFEKRKDKKKFLNSKYKMLNTIVNGFMDFNDTIKPFITSSERIKKLEEFDNLKNQGLYVDYQDKLGIPQESFNQELFNQTKELTNRIFKFYKGINLIYHPSLKNHLPERKIKKHQNDLKLFINDALKGFSFKSLNN